MKSLIISLILIFTASVFASGTDTKPLNQYSSDKIGLLFGNDSINATVMAESTDSGTDTIFKLRSYMAQEGGSDTIFGITRGGVESKPFDVYNFKYAGETQNSVYLILNDESLAVEIKDSEIMMSNSLNDAIKAAVENQNWISVK